MTALRPEARQLFQAAKVALSASESDQRRVLGLIQNRLAPALGASLLTTTSKVSTKSALHKTTLSLAMKWLSGVVLVVGLGAGDTSFKAVDRVGSPSPRSPEPVAVRAQAAAAERPLLLPPVPAAPVGLPEEKPPTPQLRTHERPRLSEEIELIQKAETQLHRGDAAGALATLALHQRRFPNGGLREERQAARILALCKLGRVGEARSEISGLERAVPGSLHLARAVQACNFADAKAH